jgi:hypothetical protein
MKTIGAVGFAKAGETWAILGIMGDEKLARDGKELPDGLHLVGQRNGSGYENITREHVDWSGLR